MSAYTVLYQITLRNNSYFCEASSCVTAMTISPLLDDCRNDTKLALSAQ